MREREMRQRVERFLRARLGSMLVPATLGLGLSLGACDGDALNTSDDGGTSITDDAGASDLAVPKYLAPTFDARSELPAAVPDYMAMIPRDDAGTTMRYRAPMPEDARLVAIYSAQLPVPR